MSDLIVILIVLLYLIIFPLFWLTVVYLIGRLGAWHRLAQQFATTRQPYGEQHRWQSVRLSWLSQYSSVVNLWVADDGLFLQTTIFFRVGHPTLLIPWPVFSGCKPRKTFLFHSLACVITLPDGGRRTLTLFGKHVVESVSGRVV